MSEKFFLTQKTRENILYSMRESSFRRMHMQDRFYVGGDLGKRYVATPMSVGKFKKNSFSEIIPTPLFQGLKTEVVRVYNANIEKIPVKF